MIIYFERGNSLQFHLKLVLTICFFLFQVSRQILLGTESLNPAVYYLYDIMVAS